MPAPDIGRVKLWRFYADHQIRELERVTVEEARACPECPGGVMNRVSERQFRSPYRWIPVGYRCSNCGTMYVSKRSLV